LKTAAAFLKGLLAFEGALAPILASMVSNNDESKSLLDDSDRARTKMQDNHSQLRYLMHFDTDAEQRTLNEEFVRLYHESPPDIIIKLFDIIGNPLTRMKRMQDLIEEILQQLEKLLNANKPEPEIHESYYITPAHFEKIFHSHSQRPTPRSSSKDYTQKEESDILLLGEQS